MWILIKWHAVTDPHFSLQIEDQMSKWIEIELNIYPIIYNVGGNGLFFQKDFLQPLN